MVGDYIRPDSQIPSTTTMVGNQYDQEDWMGQEGRLHQAGKPMTPRMERYLQLSVNTRSIAEQLEQLHDRDPRAWKAWRLRHERGYRPKHIAEIMGVRLRTAQRILQAGEAFMAEVTAHIPDTFAGKREQLALDNPDAHRVYIYKCGGWAHTHIADALSDLHGKEVTVSQVDYLSQVAIKALGRLPHRSRAGREMSRTMITRGKDDLG